MRIGLRCILIVLAAAALLPAQNPFRKAPPEIEEALRTRVTEFYTLYQQGKYRQTEPYIAEESRDAYFAASKSRIHGFELKDIRFAEDFQSAEVVVVCATTIALQNSGTKVQLPVHSHWKQVDGEWYALMGRREDQGAVDTPFGKMKLQTPGGTDTPKLPQPVNPASFAGMYSLSGKRVLKFSANSDQPATQTITLSNKGPVPLKLRQETQDVDGLEIGSEPLEIKEGETMTVSFTYNPTIGKLKGTRKIEFTVLPINQAFMVTALFAE
jgi:hypothetical protein